jgi:hypothetical protein
MRLQSDRRRLALDGLAVAAATASLWYVLGPVGLAVAAAVAVVLGAGSAVYAYAVGQLCFVLLATTSFGDVPVVGLVVAQAGLGALLLAALVGHWPRRTAVPAAVVFVLTAVGLGSTRALEPLWLGVAVLAGLYVFLAYTLHRYELVRLGLVEEAER